MIYLVDTGAPFVYLSASTLQHLGHGADDGTTAEATLNGLSMPVFMSPPDSHFRDINVLGMEFFSYTQTQLEVNGKARTITVRLVVDDKKGGAAAAAE